MTLPPKQFLLLLVSDEVISQEMADSYEVAALRANIPIDEFLLKDGIIKKEAILKTKASLMNTPFVEVTTTAVDPQALGMIPESTARRYNILPYLYNPQNDVIYVAAADPFNVALLDFLEKKTQKKIILALGISEDIEKTIALIYTQGLSPEVKEALKEAGISDQKNDGKKINISFREAPIAKIINTILEFAVRSRASDIHIEAGEAKTRVRYRIDGILQEKLTLPKAIHESLVSRVKILSEMKIDEKRIPQDGRFTFRLGIDEVDLRVSTLPTVNGEKIVMRLLKKTGGLPTLTELGLHGSMYRDLEEATQKPYGIILVTGPTGSGKTTTLYSILSRLNKQSVNIVTLEDPVEYQIAGINQVQVNPQAGLTFANGLRSFLRQDPNIILVGEIRDPETTQLAIQAALTGHLVFSTLHTNDAATAIPRLIDLGGEPFLIASIVNVSIAQRIVRKNCKNCLEWYIPDEHMTQLIKNTLGSLLPKEMRDGTKPIQVAKSKGCIECGNTGYFGRIAIFEVLKITPAITKMILREASAKEIEEQAINEGLIMMKQDGFLKVLDGITTVEEVLRVAEVL